MVVAQVVAHQTTDPGITSSIPLGSWAFSSLPFPTSINQWCNLVEVQFSTNQQSNEGLVVCSLMQNKLNMHGMSKKETFVERISIECILLKSYLCRILKAKIYAIKKESTF